MHVLCLLLNQFQVLLYAASISIHHPEQMCQQALCQCLLWTSVLSNAVLDSGRSGVTDDTGKTSFNIFHLWIGMYSSEFDEEYEDAGDGDDSRLGG
jgi:hypothetical protein